MRVNEFRKWLADQGVSFKNGKNHEKLYYNGKRSILSRHGSEEIKKGTMEGIKKQLGLK